MDHPKLEALKKAWHEKRSVTMVYILLRTSVVLVMLAQIFNRNFENVFLCVLTLILFMLPSTLERKLDLDLPNTLEIIILLFIYAAEILGEIGAYYVTFPYWDTVLHTLNGFLCAAIGFSLLDILNRHNDVRFHLSPLYLAIMSFCFSMTVGVIWEFFECTMDQLFFLDMQKDTVVSAIGSIMLDPTGGNTPIVLKNITDVIVVQADGTQTALGLGGYLDIGLLDTMEDLFVNFIGALTFSIMATSTCAAAAKASLPSALSPSPTTAPLWRRSLPRKPGKTREGRNDFHLLLWLPTGRHSFSGR